MSDGRKFITRFTLSDRELDALEEQIHALALAALDDPAACVHDAYSNARGLIHKARMATATKRSTKRFATA